jgi:MATE family multidrug resistance protein
MSQSIVRDTLRVAIPVVGTQLGAMAMGIVDTIMVGHLGPEPLSAVALGNSLSFTMIIVCIGTLMALDPVVSQAYGARRFEACGWALRHGLVLALGLTVPLTIILSQSRPLLDLLRQDPSLIEGAGQYVDAILLGLFPFLGFTVLRQFMQGISRPRAALVVVIVANLLHVLLNWMWIYGRWGAPPMGSTGAAWSTTVSRWFMLIALAAWVYTRPTLRKFGMSGWPRPLDRVLLRRLLHLGLPIGGQFGMEVSVFAMTTMMMGWFGPVQLAAHQIALNLCSTTFMVPLGFSATAAVLVGQALGRDDVAGARRAAFTSYALGIGFMGLAAISFALLPEVFVRIYTGDVQVIGMGVSLLLVGAAFQLSDGTQTISLGALRGAADTRVPMVVAAIAYWGVGLPLGWVLAFPLGLGPPGLWWGLTCGLTVVGAVLSLRFHLRVRAERVVALRAV